MTFWLKFNSKIQIKRIRLSPYSAQTDERTGFYDDFKTFQILGWKPTILAIDIGCVYQQPEKMTKFTLNGSAQNGMQFKFY